MQVLPRAALLLCCVAAAASTEQRSSQEAGADDCVIELHCEECVPEHMPRVTSHGAAGGRLVARAGDTLRLACGRSRLAAWPHLPAATLSVVCEAGRYRAPDGSLRHLLELGCQEDVFEDVEHAVEHCAPPLQGRAYRTIDSDGGVRHLAAACFDPERAVGVRALAAGGGRALPLPPHAERAAPLSLLGNFQHMFDAGTRAAAARLYGDLAHTNRRLRELLKHEDFSFAGQTLAAARLLSPLYFDDQDVRVANFESNKVAAWSSVAEGNLRHVQRDVARLLARAGGEARVYAGTHGVAALRTDGRNATEIYLKEGRFPVPKYVWTLVAVGRRALAVLVLNEPFVAVSEVRAAVPCASLCARVRWLQEGRRGRRWETPLYGLTACCGAHEAAAALPELPRALLHAVPPGDAGLLLDLDHLNDV